MGVRMAVSRADVGAEVEMMIVDTHVATETVQTRVAAEMEISIEEEAALAHVLEVPEIHIVLEEETDAIAMILRAQSQEMIVEIEMRVDEQVEARSARVHLH